MNILLTGCAGFIGWKTGELLIADGPTVTGVDILNDHCDVSLKSWRLSRLRELSEFRFQELDAEDSEQLEALMKAENFDAVIHLARRAGVRYSMENPKGLFGN